MADDKQIKQWLADGTISQSQADKMLSDSKSYKKEQSSNRIIIAASTIGAILLGIGAILFIASNWRALPNIVKTFLILGATFVSYYLGYQFRYQKKNLPKVGSALFFLGALLFGASLFLIAQIYNIEANSSVLLFIWLLGVLPLVYAFLSVSIAVLSVILGYVWIGFLFVDIMSSSRSEVALLSLPLIYLLTSIILFGIGALHYRSERLKNIARTYRIFSIKTMMVILFLLTFDFFNRGYAQMRESALWLTMVLVGMGLAASVISIYNMKTNPSKSDSNTLENTIALVLVGIAMVLFFVPLVGDWVSIFYGIFFNLLLASIIFILLYIGYTREDMQLVNTGVFWLAMLIIVRYFDWFWSLLDRSIFFMVGGLILVLGGVALEKKRRRLKTQFGK